MNKYILYIFAAAFVFAAAFTSCNKDKSVVVNVSALSVDKPEWMPTARQLANTAVEKAGTVDISSNGNSSVTITIDKSITYQEIWGFGASIVGPAENFKRDLSEKNQTEVFDLLFSNEDDNVGLTITRMNINPRVQPVPGEYIWDFDNYQAWFAKEVYKRYPTPVTAVPWTPPAWMKYNNSFGDGSTDETDGRLMCEHYGTLAQWLYDWTYYYRDTHGLNIKWLSIQNEPNANVKWDNCHYDAQEMEKALRTTIDFFRSKGSTVAIGGPECGHDKSAQEYLDGMSPEILEKMDWIAHHGYQQIRQPQNDLDFRKYGKPNLMTELCGGAAPTNDLTIVDGLLWASHIQRALSRDERGYLYWQLLRDAPSNQSLLVLKTGQDVYVKSKRVSVFGQYSRFIRPGYMVVDAMSNDDNLLVTAAKHPKTGNTSVVVANRTENDITVIINGLAGKTIGGRITSEQYDFATTKDMTATGSDFTVKIPAKSVVSVAEK